MYRSLFVNQETLHPIQILAFSITTMYVREDYKSTVGLDGTCLWKEFQSVCEKNR